MNIRDAQANQPWTVPYAKGVEQARESRMVPHILASHCVLHAMKTVGKLAAVFEAMEHVDDQHEPTDAQLATIKAMSADLMTEALRFANLYGFDLETELLARRAEKNPGPPLPGEAGPRCGTCLGSGKDSGWKDASGWHYRKCRDCNGTGNPTGSDGGTRG